MCSRGRGEYRLLRFSCYTIVPRGYFPLFSFLCYRASLFIGLDPKVDWNIGYERWSRPLYKQGNTLLVS